MFLVVSLFSCHGRHMCSPLIGMLQSVASCFSMILTEPSNSCLHHVETFALISKVLNLKPLFRWLASRKTEIRGSRGSLVLSLSRRRSNPLWTFRQRALRPWEQLLNAIQNGQWHSFELNRPGVRARGSKRTDGCTLKGCPQRKKVNMLMT